MKEQEVARAMAKPTWETFVAIFCAVVVFVVPVVLYLMEKAGINIIWILAVGWISIALACLYLVLNIPWVWAETNLGILIWRVCFVSAAVILLVGYFATRIWPNATFSRSQPAVAAAPKSPEELASKSAPETHGATERLSVFTDSVGALLTPARRGIPKQLNFTTSGAGSQEFSFEEHPRRVLFEPPMTIVEEKNLPKEIEIGGTKASVIRFSGKGFVIDDHGIRISGRATLLEAAADSAPEPGAKPTKSVSPRSESPSDVKLEATFHTLDPERTPLRELTVPLTGDVVTLELNTLNSGSRIAEDVDIWFRICDLCQYAEEPLRGVKPDGALEADRQFHFSRIDPGTLAEKITMKIRVPATLQHFWIGMFYSCDGSPQVDPKHPQMLRVHISH
jgi:hypothetical protein